MADAPTPQDTPIFRQVVEEFRQQKPTVSVFQLMNRQRWTPDAVDKEFYRALKRTPIVTDDGRTLEPIVVEAEYRARARAEAGGISRRPRKSVR